MRLNLAFVWLCLPGVTAFGQTAKPPAFEVVSIKPAAQGNPGPNLANLNFKSAAVDPTLFSLRKGTLKALIGYAYGMEDYQISGVPAWAETDRYDLDAHPASASTEAEMLLMLRTLLADRFQLTFHRDSKVLPLNVLTVAKGGPKFSPQFQVVNESDPPEPPAKQVLDQIHFQRSSMKTFATFLRLNLTIDRLTHQSSDLRDIPPVLDQTGLTGHYDITVDIRGIDSWPAMLEHQLGFKLELRKMPTEILVIDSAAKPSGN